MIMFELFEKYKANSDKLVHYGFLEKEGIYRISRKVMSGDFQMLINVEDSSVSFQLFDCETGDEYRQVHMESMAGEFVGQVRQACLDVLLDIRRHCFDEIGFLYEQSQRLVAHVSECYQGSLEYLWAKSSRKSSTQAAVFRHEGTKKWYGAFLTTDWSKFESGRSGAIEVLNVKNNQVSERVQEKGIYPAFHMNKKYWLSLPLDDTLTDQELFSLLEESFLLTKKK
ncbi:hypothetical protein D8808_05425 [Streptococcus gordonii]|nr:hypothetical protein D8808_05425 [Streptococcus gordonii]